MFIFISVEKIVFFNGLFCVTANVSKTQKIESVSE